MFFRNFWKEKVILGGISKETKYAKIYVQLRFFLDLGDPYGTMGHDVYGGHGADLHTLPRDMTLDGHTAMEYQSSIPAPSFSPTSQNLTSGPSDVNNF